MKPTKVVLSFLNVHHGFSDDLGCCRNCEILHWNELDRIRRDPAKEAYADEYFKAGGKLPSIDAFMRDFKEKVKSNRLLPSPDADNKNIHQKFTDLAQWMMVDIPNRPARCTEVIDERKVRIQARTIGEARTKVSEWRHMGHLAKKSAGLHILG